MRGSFTPRAAARHRPIASGGIHTGACDRPSREPSQTRAAVGERSGHSRTGSRGAILLALLLGVLALGSCAAVARDVRDVPVRAEEIPAYGAPARRAPLPAERRIASQLPRLREMPWDDALAAAARELALRALSDGNAEAAVDPEEVRLAQARAGAIMADYRTLAMRAGTLAAATDRLRPSAAKVPVEPGWSVGAGIAGSDGEGGVVVVVLVARVGARLEPVPATLPRGATIRLAGTLVDGAEAPELTVTSPRGNPAHVPLEVGPKGSFRGVIRFDEPGRWWVEILGRGKRGPGVAALLPLYVGAAIPDRASESRPPPEPSDVAAKERLLAAETNRLRSTRGLGPLIVDPLLSRVARAYAEELRATGRFAHVSERSGDVGARLQAAGYSYAKAGENLAQAPTALLAHRSLLRSPAHLAVLTHPAWREAGFGVALVPSASGTPEVIVVEVFAAPAD